MRIGFHRYNFCCNFELLFLSSFQKIHNIKPKYLIEGNQILEAMKKLYISIIISVLFINANAQLKLPEGLDKSQTEPAVEKKVDYSFSTGTSFFSSPGHANGSSFYLAPEFKFKLSPKFKVNAGIMLMQNRFNYSGATSMIGERSVVLKSGPSYDGVVYADGNYALNAKLTLSGSIIKSFTPGGSTSQNMAWQNSFQAMSLGLNYKLSERTSFGIGVHLIQSNGYNPYSGYNYMGSGLGYSPMNSFADPFR